MEDDAHASLTGEELTNKIDDINLEKQQELDQLEHDLEEKAREDEIRMREELQGIFFQDKEALVLKDHQRKRAMLEQVVERHPEEPLVQELGTKLLSRLGKGV